MGPWTVAALMGVAALTTETGHAVARKAARSCVRIGLELQELVTESIAEIALETREEILKEKAKSTAD